MKTVLSRIDELTGQQLEDLGFRLWDEDEESPLYLIPLRLYDYIPDGTKLTSIFDHTKIKGKDSIDLDVRFGCIAWGIRPSK